jgi:hypothetical protein
MKRTSAMVLCAMAMASCNSVGSQGGLTSLNSTVESLGFDALALPTTAFGPGSLVTSVKGNGLKPPLKLTYLCDPRFTRIPPPLINQGASTGISGAFNGSFSLDASALTQLGLGANLGFVRSVTLKLSNVTVEELAFDDLAEVRSGLGDGCRKILREFSTQSLAFQTKQAIRADVTYTVDFTAGASAEVKGLVIQSLVTAFGGKIENNSGLNVTGNGLFYGLVLTKI